MNTKFTQKVETYLAAAAELAQESSHQQLTPVHLAIAMFEDPEGIGKQSVVKAGGEEECRGCAYSYMLMRVLVGVRERRGGGQGAGGRGLRSQGQLRVGSGLASATRGRPTQVGW